VALNLAEKPCLVVGGGALVTEKVHGLLRAKANVTLVDPTPGLELLTLAELGEITLHPRSFAPSDVHEMALVYGAHDDRDLNANVGPAAPTFARWRSTTTMVA